MNNGKPKFSSDRKSETMEKAEKRRLKGWLKKHWEVKTTKSDQNLKKRGKASFPERFPLGEKCLSGGGRGWDRA